MDTPKRAPDTRGLVALAYSNGSIPKWKRQEQSVPGPLFDIFVIGTFVIFLIGYLA